MKQLIRDVPERFPQAEHRAEMQLLEYLDQYYEIEKILAVGKNIREYSPYVSYPGQAWIKKDEEIFKTLMHINGYKKPTKIEYWRQVVDFIDPRLIDHAHKYSQLRTYPKGEIVRFGTEYWQCMVPHGYESGEIHMPGVKAWREAEITPWEPNMEWEKNQVCSFNDQFYQYLGNDESEEPEETPEPFPEEPEPTEPSIDDDSEISTQNEEGEEEIGEGDEEPVPTPDLPADETVLTPEEDDCWGLIGDYSEELEYDYSEGAFDYVVAEGTVFYPVFNPNPDELIEGVNITRDDPRNANVVAHMSRMALYHLHSIISATNIPETRRWAYEDSIQWLYNASKFKINPQLPRKRERDSCAPKVDWALETFQRSYDPEQNPWLI
ncbi:hypothetical protein [Duncaniella dubosii]|uniref:hypothetical protein n=2 Tax=Bacteroidales TaxID=171549 RepID=UPI0032B18FBC